MKSLWMMVTLVCLTAALPALATQRYVSSAGAGQYTTLNSAYTAAVTGDTILVGPGTYTESPINQQKRIVWIGAGWDQTIINLTSSNWYLNTATANRSEIEGFRFELPSGGNLFFAANNPDSIAFRRCLIRSGGFPIVWTLQSGRLFIEDCIIITTHTSAELISVGTGPVVIRGCILAFGAVSTSTACISNTSGNAGTLELYNNIFLSYSKIFNLSAGAQPILAFNNVFYDWGASPTFGTYNAGSTFDYNASSGPAVPGTNGINLASNPFVNYDPAGFYVVGTSDVHLAGGSVLINAGHPSLLDMDGSRSDCGVYGGPKPLVDNGVPFYPWAINVLLTPNLVGQGTPVNASASGRVGPQY